MRKQMKTKMKKTRIEIHSLFLSSRWRHFTALYTPLNGIDCCFSFLISGIAMISLGCVIISFLFFFGCNQNQAIECICYILTSMCCCRAGRGGTCVPAQSSVFSPLAIPAFLFSSSQHPFLKFYSIQFGHISRFLSCFYVPYLSQERFASAMALQETAVYCTVRGWSLLLFAHINVTESSFS